ncbi:hypothetical protein [Archaeoglobus profundus]|uniref:Zona occludens toxin N-terminal domain-containing protein n=2 Tax=root TaxID=1 RepID=D2RFD8_ARCPA|nr:hypothetical protein [Archaeoglobus profundus]ADB58832.1 hypothetical protein Arcpr_1788 [Archaeoglobus profundus DSM 5631]
MSDKLFKYIQNAIEKDGFLFIGILGNKGFGKSVLGLNLVSNVLGDWKKVLKHTIFTIQDFQNIDYRDDLERYEDGRVKIILWDDFALHASSYGFWKADRENLTNFIEEFEIVREYVAVLVVTCATWEMIPPKLREQAHIMIQMTKRGQGEIWKKTRGWLFLKKEYKKIGEISTEKIPDEIYNRYRQLKHKAVRVKRKIDLLRREEKAKELAERLTEKEWEDEELLIALGIKDVHGNLTEFGELVVKYYNGKENGRCGCAVVKLTFREFANILRSCGIRGDDKKFLRAYNEFKKRGYVKEVMN